MIGLIFLICLVQMQDICIFDLKFGFSNSFYVYMRFKFSGLKASILLKIQGNAWFKPTCFLSDQGASRKTWHVKYPMYLIYFAFKY